MNRKIGWELETLQYAISPIEFAESLFHHLLKFFHVEQGAIGGSHEDPIGIKDWQGLFDQGGVILLGAKAEIL